jgi:endonuclease/exonuclease/phosphatase family metal-dependent hydrolase
LSAFANLAEMQGADIVLLQEVTRTSKFKVDEWLADRLGMGYAYVRANGHESEIGFEEGLAVFSRFPLEGAHWQQLGTSPFQMSRRMALGADVKTPCGNLKVFSVHLGISSQANRSQLGHLKAWVSKTAKEQTSFIGGDFNTHEDRSHIRSLQKEWVDIYRYKNPDRDGTTHELRWPWGKTLRQHRLDYLFMQKGLECWDVLDAEHIHAQTGKGSHSDHLAVLARVMPI